MPARSWHRPAIALLLLMAACSPGSPAASGEVSATPSTGPSAGQAGSLPSGCGPIDVRGPSGESVVLDGMWLAEEHNANLPQTWWIRTLGDCLWGAGVAEGLFDSDAPGRVQTLRGTIGEDFVVDGEILQLATTGFEPILVQFYSPLRMFIEFDDDGTIVLREDREYGVPGPRCPDPTFSCLPVLVLRAEQTANETPDASAD
jgi:hypothetical protein